MPPAGTLSSRRAGTGERRRTTPLARRATLGTSVAAAVLLASLPVQAQPIAARRPPGGAVSLEVLRGTRLLSVTVPVTERPGDPEGLRAMVSPGT